MFIGSRVAIRRPGWVLPGAIIDADFVNNRYWGTTLNSLFTLTRTTVGMARDLSGNHTTFAAGMFRITNKGLLTEGARTNLFLNSDAPATQSITVVNGSTYTVSVFGNASVALSGGGSGTASAGSPVTFAASTTSVTCTVSGAGGSFQNVNFELGAFATSPILTTGSTATRNADSILFAGRALQILGDAGQTYTIIIKSPGVIGADGNSRLLGQQAQILWAFSGLGFQAYDASNANALAINDVTLTSPFRVGLSNSATKRVITADPCTPAPSASSANVMGTWVNPKFAGTAGATDYWHSYNSRLAIFNVQLSDAQMAEFLRIL